jgi:hypothetical protein
MVRQIHALFYNRVIILFICIADVNILELLVLLVLMRIGPPHLRFLSRLTTLLSTVDGTVHRRLHTLPMVSV